jgi:hypothetical protein
LRPCWFRFPIQETTALTALLGHPYMAAETVNSFMHPSRSNHRPVIAELLING